MNIDSIVAITSVLSEVRSHPIAHHFLRSLKMSIPASPVRTEWQSAPRVPKLGYRKALSEVEAEELKSQMRESAAKNSNLVRKDSVTSSTWSSTPVSASSVSKKKGSFLSGIFAKEPTITALANFEADVKAKYGAATPQAVPHVSSRKMPEHVPKVNSKWDGVPEVVKQREKGEKTKRPISQQSVFTDVPRTGVSQTTNDSVINSQNSQRRGSKQTSDSASQTGSSYSGAGKEKCPRRNSMQSSYSNESHTSHVNERPPPSTWSQSSLPEISCYFPDQQDRPTSAKLPQRWQSTNSSKTSSTESSTVSRSDSSQYTQATSAFDVIPEHSSSPVRTPRELSPVTPGYALDQASPRSATVSAKPVVRPTRIKPVAIDAFLAGEAKPLSLDDDSDGDGSDLPLRNYQQSILRVQSDVAQRPDSSRARLGLRASMLVANDSTPWDTQDLPPTQHSSLRSANRPRLPKALAMLKK